MRDQCERLLLYYNRRGLLSDPDVLGRLLERKATSISDHVQSMAENFGSGKQ